MSQIIKVDFRKAAPEPAKRVPLDERALWEWRKAQRAKDNPVWTELGRRIAEARTRDYARNILPRGIGISEYASNEPANKNWPGPACPRTLWNVTAAMLAT